jgi:hypothetical protein
VAHGTYGNRQVLKLDTNGPYTHLIEFWRIPFHTASCIKRPGPLIPVLRGQRQADFSEVGTSLVYVSSSRTARTTQWDSDSKNQKLSIYAGHSSAHTFNSSTWEAEAGGSLWVWGQPGPQCEF